MDSLSKSPPPLGSVLLKSSANSSLPTQCAAVASVDVYCPTVFHCLLCRASSSTVNRIGSFKKLLSPPLRSKCSLQKLNMRLLFLMGGVKCHLQVEFGGEWWHRSFFPKNWWDFPLHLFALLIFTWNHLTCWTTSNIWCFIPLWKTETSRRLEVTINVSSPITVHMSHLCVLGHSHQETPTLFSTILLSLMHSHNVNGNSSKGRQSLKEMWLSRNCEMFSLLMN